MPWYCRESSPRGNCKDTYHADQKPVVREKLEPRRLDVRLKLVQLNAVAVIDEHILLLRYRKM